MKILFLEASQSFGGAQKSTLDIASQLQRIGHQILIVDFWGSSEEFIQEIKVYNLNYMILENRQDSIIISNPVLSKKIRNGLKFTYKNIIYRNKLKDIINEFSPDIVSVHNIKCLSILERNAAYKIDYIERGWSGSHQTSRLKRFFLKKFKPRIITVSQASRQAVFTAGIENLENIKVMHDAIDDNVYLSEVRAPSTIDFSNQPIRLLHSGGFISTKGQHVAIEVARELKRKSIEFELVLMGVIYPSQASKDYYNYLLKLIEKYKLTDQVTMVVNQYDVLDYFSKCHVLIHPSATEGLPRVALEALSFGKPVIANPVGGVIDVVINNVTGYITDYNDIEQYVEFITKYINTPSIYQMQSKNAKMLIKNNYLKSNQKELLSKLYPPSL